MNTDNVKKFYEALKSDKGMADELEKAVVAAKPETEDRAAELVVKLAAEKGYVFTTAELKALDAETKKLGMEELDKVNAAGNTYVWPPWTCSLLWR